MRWRRRAQCAVFSIPRELRFLRSSSSRKNKSDELIFSTAFAEGALRPNGPIFQLGFRVSAAETGSKRKLFVLEINKLLPQ